MKYTHKILIAMLMATTIIAGSTVSATYAWYQLQQNKTINVSGTTLGNSADITIGFVSDVDLSYAGITYSSSDSTSEGKKIYWADNSKDVTSDIVSYVLAANGYANENVYPVTSGKYAKGGDLALYNAPVLSTTWSQYHTLASKQLYMHLGLAFKVTGGSESVSNTGVKDANIYFTSFQIGGDVKKGVRMHLSSNTVETLICPAASASGKTQVGGALDLDQDNKFDSLPSTDGIQREVFYGQNDSDIVYGDAYADTVSGNRDQYDNCFVANNHDKGVLPLKDTANYASYAEYEDMTNYLYPSSDETVTIAPISKTDSYGIGFLNMDIYLEGWDTATVNQTIGTTFGSSMAFAPASD
jgi:hypothetical protein